MVITMTMFQPVFGSIGPGTDTLKTDDGTPVKVFTFLTAPHLTLNLFQEKTKMMEG
ncbi:MAG: hypothetical protein ACLRR3_04505 [Eubacterium sp.]